MRSLSQRFGNLVLTFALVLAGASARAETFPNKPVHILVPYAAGVRSTCSRARSVSRSRRAGASSR